MIFLNLDTNFFHVSLFHVSSVCLFTIRSFRKFICKKQSLHVVIENSEIDKLLTLRALDTSH